MTSQRETKEYVILGGGISGLSLAYFLAEEHPHQILLIESEEQLGGLSAGYRWHDVPLDLGSHRIHTGSAPFALRLMRELLDDNLLTRARKGALLLNNKSLHYPPTLLSISTSFGASQMATFLRDFVRARFSRQTLGNLPETFESYLRSRVGDSLYEMFYRPYAEKLWALPATHISYEAAAARLHRVRGLKLGTKRRSFYYPALGMQQLVQTFRDAIAERGGTILTQSAATRLRDSGSEIEVTVKRPTGPETIRAKTCISTLPLRTLWQLAGFEDLQFPLRWRSLRIVYLLFDTPLTLECDTYYLPESRFRSGRVSHVHRFSPQLPEPASRILTVEVPCGEGEALWTMPDSILASSVYEELVSAGVLKNVGPPRDVRTVRLRDVYPIYEMGWREKWTSVMSRFDAFGNLLLAGRTAMFLHCNIDHCILMSQELCNLLSTTQGKSTWRSTFNNFPLLHLKE